MKLREGIAYHFVLMKLMDSLPAQMLPCAGNIMVYGSEKNLQ